MNEASPAPIVVVSGFPRSGTSLMMQMLEAGGLPILSDGQRTADDSNPKGYYELEAAKTLSKDASCLDGAEGQAVKLIHALIPHLPAGNAYRVVMMRRELDEVLASQASMLNRLGKDGAALPADKLRAVFETQMKAAESKLAAIPGAERLDVPHRQLIEQPTEQAQAVAAFLDGVIEGGLDAQAMAAVVDPSLYRERGG